MGIFENCLLASDIDDTLLSSNTVNPVNIEKIEYFMSEGGYFSLATGRSVTAVSIVLDKLKRVSPCVVANGCMIYDYENNKPLHEEYVPESDYFITKKVLENFPKVGIEINTGNRIFTLNRTEATDKHQIYEKLETTVISFDEVAKYKWNKSFFAPESEEARAELNKYISQFETKSDFFNTIANVNNDIRYYFEQVPRGVSKASTILKLADILGIPKGRIFTIGDYYNDVEMLKMADISAAVADSPDDVKSCADYITCSCKDGAVADFIDYLAKKFGNIPKKGLI